MAAKTAEQSKTIPLKPLKARRSERLVKGTQQSLCQALVPKVLFEACRAQLDQDGLTWRDVVRWALVEYLVMRNPEKGRKVWSNCV
jgi:hypothetical protein